MADVRSLLRQERAARQAPSRPSNTPAAPAAAPSGRKRKAIEETGDDRKRSKVEEAKGLPAGFFDGDAAAATADESRLPSSASADARQAQRPPQLGTRTANLPSAPPPRLPTGPAPVPEEEDMDAILAQIDRDNEALPSTNALSAIRSGAAIEAPAMTPAELAAQERRSENTQRGRQRDAEIEAEKEDAARQLEEEFDEMEELEQRARKLREKREALRQATVEVKMRDVPPATEESGGYEEDDESDSDDEDDGWDGWRFHAA